MFGFKKKPPITETKVEAPAILGMSEVYVMPDKYLPPIKGSNKKIIIASLILLAVMIVTGGFFAYDMISRQKAVTISGQLEPPKIEISEEMPPVNEGGEETIIDEEVPIVTTTTPQVETTTPAVAAVASVSIDSDNDGLTDVEETIFGTSPSNSDTDNDGYKDGIEVINGYNPTKPGTSKLIESPFISSITTDFSGEGYALLFPKEWQTSLVNSNKQLLISVGSGEVIKISIRDNASGLSPLAWYLQDHPEVAVSQLKLIETQDGKLSGIYSADGFMAYLTNTDKSKFYVFEYLSGRQTELRYPTIFNMVIKNLAVSPKKEVPPPVATPTVSDEEAPVVDSDE